MTGTRAVLEVDRGAGAAYLSLSDNEVDRTVEVVPEVQVDLDKFGVAVGVEILDLNMVVPIGKISSKCHIRSEKLAALSSLRGTVNSFVMRSSPQGSANRTDSSHFEFS